MAKKIKKARIARVSTVPLFIFTLLRTQVEAIVDAGADVTIITSPDDLQESMESIEDCRFLTLNIDREIRPFSDLISLVKLIKLFRKEQFDIVHSNTPKAGLLCAIAAKLTGVPIRLHSFTGQPWVTMSGMKRLVVKFCDKLIALLNTYCYADSPSQSDFLIQHKIIDRRKISVLGSGSIAGVDLARFDKSNFSILENKNTRISLGIKDDELVLLFLGRITKDKGIFELIESFSQLLKEKHNIVLLIVGPFEQGIEQEIRAYAKHLGDEKIVFAGFSSQPENYMAIADILCLPSYREGFGTVVIEAAAMELPTVGTRIYGLTDAIVDGETGLLVEPKDVLQLTEALKAIILDNELRLKMAKNARERVVREFDSKKFDILIVNEYEKLLEKLGFQEKNKANGYKR
ncbi:MULTISPECIES: glycosyltransferase family 4 protein [unclassified Legionella]|uniref:glycosyltransferase family 4 protein n=1 Tax=unclassified Legionella TaxID=2622702 RepID=UPI0010547208|nr:MULTISPECIES: glycosyltransferase family 4 protein [unclassified Legionella]MDI9817776.1 glycosyltransferase family 4 protein [Legionella sp. PL877]